VGREGLHPPAQRSCQPRRAADCLPVTAPGSSASYAASNLLSSQLAQHLVGRVCVTSVVSAGEFQQPFGCSNTFLGINNSSLLKTQEEEVMRCCNFLITFLFFPLLPSSSSAHLFCFTSCGEGERGGTPGIGLTSLEVLPAHVLLVSEGQRWPHDADEPGS